MKLPEPLITIGSFFVRVVTGIVLFVLMGLAAYALSLLTSYAETHHLLPDLMLGTLRVVEYIIFSIDVVVFIVFLVKEALIATGVTRPKK
jgi:hypothetical protein